MRQSNQDFTARTSYDTILPPDARQEMLKPKRPAILRRPLYRYPAPARSGILKWAGAFALCAIILAGVIGHYSQSVKAPATPQHATPVLIVSSGMRQYAAMPTFATYSAFGQGNLFGNNYGFSGASHFQANGFAMGPQSFVGLNVQGVALKRTLQQARAR
jgi:hypothetical protein